MDNDFIKKNVSTKMFFFTENFPDSLCCDLVIKQDLKLMNYFWTQNAWQSFFLHAKNSRNINIKHKIDSLLVVSFDKLGNFFAFGLFSINYITKEVELLKVCVINDMRGVGIATSLLKRTFLELKSRGVIKVFLAVEKSNKHAIKLYRKLNFKIIENKKRYYSDNRDALIMAYEFI